MLPLRTLFLVLILSPMPALAQQARLFTADIPVQVSTKPIGGQHVEVESLVRPDFDLQHDESTAQQIQALSQGVSHLTAHDPSLRF